MWTQSEKDWVAPLTAREIKFHHQRQKQSIALGTMVRCRKNEMNGLVLTLELKIQFKSKRNYMKRFKSIKQVQCKRQKGR